MSEASSGGQGEVVNCVEILLQHGFDHPIKELPPADAGGVDRKDVPAPGPDVTAYGTVYARCPEGTVPQLRFELEEIEKYVTLEAWFNRIVRPWPEQDYHQWSATYNLQVDNNGGFSNLSLHNPTTVFEDMSLSQIWVGGGDPKQTVEGGWQVQPSGYQANHPYEPHVFIFMTLNNYALGSNYYNGVGKPDGSYWFTQTDNYITLGGYIPASATSPQGGAQVDIANGYTRDSFGWWYWWNGHKIGYQNANFFDSPGMRTKGSKMQFGGEIYDWRYAPGAVRTATDMGSNYNPATFPTTFSSAYGQVAYQRDMKYLAVQDGLWHYMPSGTFSTSPDCYSNLFGTSAPSPYNWSNYLFFGGRGYAHGLGSCLNYPP